MCIVTQLVLVKESFKFIGDSPGRAKISAFRGRLHRFSQPLDKVTLFQWPMNQIPDLYSFNSSYRAKPTNPKIGFVSQRGHPQDEIPLEGKMQEAETIALL